MSTHDISEDEKIWAFIAWLIPLIGGILALVLKPSSKYSSYWAYLSISFFLCIIGASIVSSIFLIIPFIGKLVETIIWIGILVVWILGILRSLEKTWWKLPVVYEIARLLNPKIDEYIPR